MPILLIKKEVEDKEEFDKLFYANSLPDEEWIFIEKEESFSEKVNSFINDFINKNNISNTSELLTDFLNYIRDQEKIIKIKYNRIY